ncbi:phage tail protein [Streptomyces sp. NPDC013087]|uniref:phage tail protein n=2 Tax=Streptomyces TaxID=1883 RepID=UPI0033C9EF4B
MRDLFVQDLSGRMERLTDYSVTRKNAINNEKTIDVSCAKTDRNAHSFPMVQNENIFLYEDEEYVIKQTTLTARGVSSTGIHRVFCDLRDLYIYEVIEGENKRGIQSLLTIALDGSGYSFTVDSALVTMTAIVEDFGDASALELLTTICEKFGVEFECVGKMIYIAKEIARYTDHQLRYHFNVNAPSKEIATNDIKTYIRGYGKQYDETDIFDEYKYAGSADRSGTWYEDAEGAQEFNSYNPNAGLEFGVVTQTNNDYFTFNFTGTGLRMKMITSFLGGKVKFDIDNGAKTKTVSLFKDYGGKPSGVEVFEIARGLENKTHTVKVSLTGKDGSNPYTTGSVRPVFIMPKNGDIIGVYRLRKGDDEVYTSTAEYTSPLASVYGIRHAKPLRDDQYTDKASLLAALKAELHDYFEISLTLDYVELLDFGIQDIRKGDYVWCILDPFGIDVRIRVVEIEDYSNEATAPKFTLGTLRKTSNDIAVEFKKTSNTLAKVVDSNTGKVKSSAFDLTIGKTTKFEDGYDPTQITAPTYDLASASTDGLMSSEDFAKLSNIAVDANGNVIVTIGPASELADGLMSAADFVKLRDLDFEQIKADIEDIKTRLTALEGNSGETTV